jgi:hypothetical protein
MNVPLTIPQTIALLRARYPAALLCVACGRLLTTERHRAARLTDAQVEDYTCAECRLDRRETAQSVAARVEAGRRALARGGRPERTGIAVSTEATGTPLPGPNDSNGLQSGFSASEHPVPNPEAPLAHLRRPGGRPRVPLTAQRARRTDRQRERRGAHLTAAVSA